MDNVSTYGKIRKSYDEIRATASSKATQGSG